ncbi:AAA domain-containing protein [Crepidotus variabilis]|uniref:AAA domain-containing protein n=1 Tax=Crepidotus variabilis TaxID=179855 RepID=A0A9P6E2X2_9AGAR|nr:AAA domain-containing protein [Crepidotus variabilis]
MPLLPERKISFYIIGPSSSGKTTLCEALSKRLGIHDGAFVREVARTVMKEKGYSRDTIGSLQMQKDIMEAHFVQESSLDNSGFKIRVCDRSAIDAVVYAILTANSVKVGEERQQALTESPGFQEALNRYSDQRSIVLLLKPVPGWLVDDGVRSLEEQDQCLRVFKKLLADLKLFYFEVGEEMKFIEERINFAMGLAKL